MNKTQKSGKTVSQTNKGPATSNQFGSSNNDIKKQLDIADKLIRQVTKDNQQSTKSVKDNESKLEDAFRILSVICQKEETQHQAFAMRARCNYHFGDFQRALYDFSVAIRLLSSNSHKDEAKLAEYYNYAGVQHFELGQLEEALDHYRMAHKMQPTVGTYLYNKGLVLSRLDKVDEAIDDYKAAL